MQHAQLATPARPHTGQLEPGRAEAGFGGGLSRLGPAPIARPPIVESPNTSNVVQDQCTLFATNRNLLPKVKLCKSLLWQVLLRTCYLRVSLRSARLLDFEPERKGMEEHVAHTYLLGLALDRTKTQPPPVTTQATPKIPRNNFVNVRQYILPCDPDCVRGP